MNKKFKDIYIRYKYLATTPAKVDMALLIASFSLVFIIFGIDFCCQVSANTFSKGFVLISLIAFVSCFVYIAHLRETPDSMPFSEQGEFNFRRSLKMTRLIQNELVETVDGNKIQHQKENNGLRLLSFVVVVNRNAYNFMRQPSKIEKRKDLDVLMEGAKDIADNLNLSVSSFQPLNVNRSIGLGHYYFQNFLAMELR